MKTLLDNRDVVADVLTKTLAADLLDTADCNLQGIEVN